MTAPPPLEAKALYVSCDQSRLHFDTTTELEELDDVLGQPRALEALHFGTGISSDGFNIYATDNLAADTLARNLARPEGMPAYLWQVITGREGFGIDSACLAC